MSEHTQEMLLHRTEQLQKSNQRIEKLEELVDQLKTVLRKVEWHWDYVSRIDECPICDNTKEAGHEVDCTLDILLEGENDE